MVKIGLILALALAIFQGIEDQAPPPDEEAQRQEILNLENENIRALQLKNPVFFKRVYGDDYLGANWLGQVEDKAKLLQAVQSPEFKWGAVVSKDPRVRLYQDTAVYSCEWSVQGNFRDMPLSLKFRILHVYVNGKRGWQLVAGQQTVNSTQAEQPKH